MKKVVLGVALCFSAVALNGMDKEQAQQPSITWTREDCLAREHAIKVEPVQTAEQENDVSDWTYNPEKLMKSTTVLNVQ